MSGLSIPDDEKISALGCTATQGQYLAFIYAYSKLNGRPPSEADMQRYFRVSPPTVHQMIMTLERHGLIERVLGQARSITLRVPPDALPILR
jgi:Mn-dependent DtxR family transcriptional regulator